ncbi:hypothetical protein CYLTODRAFT_453844 [Cylindrobasidium torrendii FP15055 ss-10]|uniref:Uncharacterized protein n=1 Tax=Cylindrobasidium torrendii FP15055 ss-10 TaxID=1314674 RepID=A0A0D7BD26_9AGAR|nr:hypothetical protein CYLTODRAFT_453844 [Cylindrobasidium torrendii FP15055 ss-10]
MSTFSESEPRDRDDLASYFDRSAFFIITRAQPLIPTRFESGFARPAIRTAKDLFDEHPLPFIFFCFFAALSIFPVILFILASTFVALSFIFVALMSALFASATIISIFTFLLVTVLMINLGIALFPTITLFWAYAIARFIALTRARGRAGASQWVQETKAFIPGNKKQPSRRTSPARSSSNGSIVVVDERKAGGTVSGDVKTPEVQQTSPDANQSA